MGEKRVCINLTPCCNNSASLRSEAMFFRNRSRECPASARSARDRWTSPRRTKSFKRQNALSRSHESRSSASAITYPRRPGMGRRTGNPCCSHLCAVRTAQFRCEAISFQLVRIIAPPFSTRPRLNSTADRCHSATTPRPSQLRLVGARLARFREP